MAKEGIYRTGQAAKALGLSPHQVRRLCETGLIQATLGPGGHWRIPASEISRLQQEGLPLIPSAADDSGPDPEANRFDERSGAKHNLNSPKLEPLRLTSPSLSSDVGVELARNFPEPSKIPKETNSGKPQVCLTEQANFQAEHAREEWRNRWLEWALLCVPWNAPNEYHLVVREQVDDTLQTLHHHTPDLVTRKLVEGAVQKALQPWCSARDTKTALDTALGLLPWSARSPSQATNWQARAREAAESAVSKLGDGASLDSKLSAATTAVRKVTLELEEETLRRKIVEELIFLPLLSPAEKEAAKAAIQIRVESCRSGSNESELRRARQIALQPFEQTQKEKANRQKLEQKIDQGLGHIRTFLSELWNDDELEGFENVVEVWSYADEIREDVRAELLRELEGYEREVSDEKVRSLIEDTVDDRLWD